MAAFPFACTVAFTLFENCSIPCPMSYHKITCQRHRYDFIELIPAGANIPNVVGLEGESAYSSECLECPAGKYSSTIAAIAASSSCSACPANSHAPAGSDALADCTCDAGSTSADGMGCAQCSAGTYRPYSASEPPPFTRWLVDGCPSHSYLQADPVLVDAHASLGEVVCCEGEFQATREGCLSGSNTAAKKTFWEAKALCEGQGWRLCRKEELITSDASGSCAQGCNFDIALVWADFDSADQACSGCPAGKYSEATGASSSGACVACSEGFISVAGSTSCDACPAGTHSAAGAHASFQLIDISPTILIFNMYHSGVMAPNGKVDVCYSHCSVRKL